MSNQHAKCAGRSAVIVYDRAGSARVLNEAARELLCPTGMETQLRTALDSVHQQVAAALQRTPAGGSTACRIMPHPEARAVEAELFVPEGDEGGGCVLVLVDDHHHRVLEEDLYAATRFRGLATLFAGAAHDLRGPLNNMVVNLELLKHGLRNAAAPAGADAAGHAQWTDALTREIHRLNRHVQTMLDLTSSAAEEEPLDLVEVLDELSRLLRATAKLHRIVLDWTLPDRPVFVQGRRDRLRQMLLNIILNGFEAMTGGGTLRVTLAQEGGDVCVKLSNSGDPIPAHVRPHLFGCHFTTKTTASGIGLYVAQYLATQLGGSISVCSDPSNLTCFSVRLPQLRADADAGSS